MNKKPLIVAKEDFELQIKNIINNSGLPIVVLHPIIKGIYSEINMSYLQQYNAEKTKYESEINNVTNKSEE